MRALIAAIVLTLGAAVATPASAGVSIGINFNAYPRLVAVPGYPVYYAPGAPTNYFFYDGFYWVFNGDGWYSSQWYNGPWDLVAPEFVPSYVLRVPVRYYVRPPAYFRGWSVNVAPRWGEHWGHEWEVRRSGWDHRGGPVPSRAPLPVYQRQYAAGHYPGVEQQRALHERQYHYQQREQYEHRDNGNHGDHGNGDHGDHGHGHDR